MGVVSSAAMLNSVQFKLNRPLSVGSSLFILCLVLLWSALPMVAGGQQNIPLSFLRLIEGFGDSLSWMIVFVREWFVVLPGLLWSFFCVSIRGVRLLINCSTTWLMCHTRLICLPFLPIFVPCI
ncbi:unnamed protein product [Linum tenue]|uniref:Uncharacterized protein n=1 Tax=Linum tenue TaxID=586396 RepID=A0AAV0NSI9_9ROSI|nr:unnamed protein product [Linum tenue]